MARYVSPVAIFFLRNISLPPRRKPVDVSRHTGRLTSSISVARPLLNALPFSVITRHLHSRRMRRKGRWYTYATYPSKWRPGGWRHRRYFMYLFSRNRGARARVVRGYVFVVIGRRASERSRINTFAVGEHVWLFFFFADRKIQSATKNNWDTLSIYNWTR